MMRNYITTQDWSRSELKDILDHDTSLKAKQFQPLYPHKSVAMLFFHQSLIILNIATPKQEILAINLLKNNPEKKLFICCLGGGMSMVSGEEKFVPEFIEKINLEWMWRFRTNTWFRLK